MNDTLKLETEKLAKSWMQHEREHLGGYLIAGVEDPRLNLQSIFSRHFLLRGMTGKRFTALMEQECRFAAVMNWAADLAKRLGAADELETILYALQRGADNAEGIQIPLFVLKTFSTLPVEASGAMVPNYLESFLAATQFVNGRPSFHQPSLECFQCLWSNALAENTPTGSVSRPVQVSTLPGGLVSVLEPACGSANDYRFLASYGIAQRVNYTGFDLCEKNIQNARALFPTARFHVGNVFEIQASDKSFELCFAHDLFEHLSLEGLQAAVKEICRVTRQGICVGFFNMDEIPEHIERLIDDYRWTTLSMVRIKELFLNYGFSARVVHIGTFLRQQIGCEHTHNPSAYTFFLGTDVV